MRRYIAIMRSSDVSRYEVSVPDFPDCEAIEDSLEKAVHSAARSVRSRIVEMRQRGEPVPEPRTVQEIRSDGSLSPAIADGILTSLLLPKEAYETPVPAQTAMAG